MNENIKFRVISVMFYAASTLALSIALTGCSHGDQAPQGVTGAQVQQNAQQQAAQRAAYFNTHAAGAGTGGGAAQNPVSNPPGQGHP